MSDEPEEIMCEECGKNRATVHLTDVVDGRAIPHHFCDECYATKQAPRDRGPAAFLSQILAALAPELKELGARQCPTCGINYLEFRQSMRLGCATDYQVFEKPLERLLERIHGNTHHCGKVPCGSGNEAADRSRLRSLHKRMEQAASEENYELAAELRDHIKELEENGPEEPQG
jgi:protein arginine kinase activator